MLKSTNFKVSNHGQMIQPMPRFRWEFMNIIDFL